MSNEPKLRVSHSLNVFAKLSKKLRRLTGAKQKQTGRASDNTRAGSLILQGEKASEILHNYFMVNNPLIRDLTQTFIVFSENVCDEQSFFTKLFAEAGLGQYDERFTPAQIAESFIKASAKKSFVLIIPNLATLSPKILNFIHAVLKAKNTNETTSLNITLVMELEKRESYPHAVQLIVQEHSDVLAITTEGERKLVDTSLIKDFALPSGIKEIQIVILSIISLFGNQEVSLK
ncbi:MAG: hypothetical protein ACHP9Y_03820, partial [Gammaproteobacteria bacterium]